MKGENMNKEHLYLLALTRYGVNAQIDMKK